MDTGGRLFTFGCSFTNYYWPTWADFIGLKFKHYENWGKPGAGNYYIASMVHECNHINKLTKDDTVIVMFTSIDRFDYVTRDSRWINSGGIYAESNLPVFGKHFIENIWSDEFGLYSSWYSISSVNELLKSINCKYKLLTAFDFLEPEGAQAHINVNSNRVKKCIEIINENLKCISLRKFKQDYSNDEYKFMDAHDGHPTITTHHDYVYKLLPEFYDKIMLELKDEWENYIKEFILKDKMKMNFSKWKGLNIKTFNND